MPQNHAKLNMRDKRRKPNKAFCFCFTRLYEAEVGCTENNVIKYFRNYASAPDFSKALPGRTARGLYRANIITMQELCALCENESEKIKKVRGVGDKGWELELEICAAYKAEQIYRRN